MLGFAFFGRRNRKAAEVDKGHMATEQQTLDVLRDVDRKILDLEADIEAWSLGERPELNETWRTMSGRELQALRLAHNLAKLALQQKSPRAAF